MYQLYIMLIAICWLNCVLGNFSWCNQNLAAVENLLAKVHFHIWAQRIFSTNDIV